MSWRIHVAGAFGASEAEFRTALDSIGGEGNGSARFRIGGSGKWAWANASVWHVNGSEIDEALSALPVPALRVTSSDGVLWMLTLTGAGKERFHGVHHFTQVGMQPPEPRPQEDDRDADFPENELEEVAGINKFVPELQFLWDAEEEARLAQEYAAEEAATVPGLDGYTDYGVRLPEAVVEEMKRRPERADYTAFMAHGRQMVDALAEYGFEFDRAAMLEFLTVGPLTDLEDGSDIGNMPRFLQMLGIAGVFQEEPETPEQSVETEREARAPEADQLDASKHPPGPLFQKFKSLVAACALTEIAGGPVQLTQPLLLHLLAHLCAEDPATSVSMEFPDAAMRPTRSWENLRDLEVQQHGARWRFCFPTPPLLYYLEDREQLESNDIAQAIGAPPDGARVEFTFAVEGLVEKCHRYAGVFRDQRLEVERAYPPVTADILRDALALVEQVYGSQSIALRSTEEEEAVRRDYQRSEDETPKIRNGKIKPEYGGRSVVVQTLLFARFAGRGPWDLAGARKLVEADWEEYDELVNPQEEDDEEDDEEDSEEAAELSEELAKLNDMVQRLNEVKERMQQEKTVPHREEVLYEGRTGNFLRASMTDLTHLAPERLQEHDAALAALGFRWIVDSVGDVDQRQEITRCYAGNPQAVSLLGHRKESNRFGWAPVSNGAVLVDFSQGTQEFHTRFEDGTTLVTTSIDAISSKPDVGVYIRCYEDIPIARLWEKHLDGIERFRTHRNTVPVDHRMFSEPASFLAMMDDLFCRFLGRD
jgi:hypothetical protein